MTDYLTEAWKALDVLNEDIFSFDKEGLEKLDDFRTEDYLEEEEEEIIDPEAETEEDLEDSYVGKIILQCDGCHALTYKDPSKIIIGEEELANTDEECPFCNGYNGFKIVGEVTEFHPKESEKDTSDEEIEKEEETADFRESLEEAGKKKPKDLWSIVYGELTEDGTQRINPETHKPFINRGAGYDINDVAPFIPGREGPGYSREGFDILRIKKNAAIGIEPARNIAKKYSLDTDESDDYLFIYIPENAMLNEGFQRVDIETDTEKMSMTSDENGKTTVTTEPKRFAGEERESEVIAPVSDEMKAEIEETEEEIPEETIEEFDEESFDELGEAYLKRVYENINSYKTSRVKMNGNSLMIEGIIGFTSGKKAKTSFLFEAKDKNTKGKVRFVGCNKQITESKNPFIMRGFVKEGKLLSESLNYNYKVKGQKDRVYGTAKR